MASIELKLNSFRIRNFFSIYYTKKATTQFLDNYLKNHLYNIHIINIESKLNFISITISDFLIQNID